MPDRPKKIVFRCDATRQLGTGHLMRCQVLAECFSALGWSCMFRCCDETLGDFSHLFKKEYEFISDRVTPTACELLVVDHYSLDSSYEAACREWAKFILVIDDLANRAHDCDYLLDQTEGRRINDYRPHVSDKCQLMLGSKYALLRESFSKMRPFAVKKREIRGGNINNILISFGGTNLHQITERVVSAFCHLSNHPLNLNVIMGAKQNISREIKALEKKINDEGRHFMTLLSSVSNIEEYMLKADLAIGAGGTTSWERCCLGLPTIMIELADNQHLIAKQLHSRGASINLGYHDNVEETDILNAVEHFCRLPQKTIEMQKIAFDICDGKGASRVSALIEKELMRDC